MPNLKNKEGFTFLGWAQTPGQKTDPELQAGEVIHVPRTTKFYPVMFDRSQEKDITLEELPELNTEKYGHAIFIGDSRFVKMRKTSEKQKMTSKLGNVSFVCKSGRGLEWFKQEGLQEMKRQIHDASLSSEKSVAIIFNLGINDLRRVLDVSKQYEIDSFDCMKISKEYISFMNDMENSLENSNCKFFI